MWIVRGRHAWSAASSSSAGSGHAIPPPENAELTCAVLGTARAGRELELAPIEIEHEVQSLQPTSALKSSLQAQPRSF
jgi:hypothetical protein